MLNKEMIKEIVDLVFEHTNGISISASGISVQFPKGRYYHTIEWWIYDLEKNFKGNNKECYNNFPDFKNAIEEYINAE